MAEVETLAREGWAEERLAGLPRAIDGGERDMTRRARRFARGLAGRFQLPVALADERLSSVTAEAHLRETGRGGRKHKNAAHTLAATIILQSYLDGSPRR